jgi:hypothetical protein
MTYICQGKLPASKKDYEFWPVEAFMEVCASYINGVVDFHDSVWSMRNDPILCRPVGLPDQEKMRRNFLSWIRSHPGEVERDGITLVLRSLGSLYPCEKKLDDRK